MSGDDNSLLSTTIYGQLIVADVPNDFVGFTGNTEIPQYAYVEIDRNCSIFGNLYIRTINGFNTDTNGSIVSLGNVNINDRIITPAITLNGEDLTSTLATKATISNPTFTGDLIAGNITSLGDISFNGLSLTTQLATKATIIDPTFTGTPLAPTASTATNTTQIATTAFVNSYVSSLGYTTGSGYAPISNPTFTGNIISLGDISFNGLSLTTALATKATIIDPTFTGTPLAPTAATATNTTQIATTAFVKAQEYATIASPSLTGTPLAPTAATATNTTQIATTAFVKAQGYATTASPSLTGTPLAPTAATATNTTQIATTAFVKAQEYATIASPSLTGTPLAPTAATATNTTQIATTAFVKAQGYATTSSPNLTGTPLAPTAATATNTTQIATTAFVKAQGYATTTYPTFTGIINITDTTQSISPTTGALVVSGGVGVSGNIISKSSLRAGNPLKTVSATPVYTSAGITQLFSSNTLTISSVSANYEYALTNGTPYTITAGGINSTNNTVYKAFNNDANYFVSSYTQEVETYYNIDTGITSVVGGLYYDLNGNTQLSSVSTTVDSVAVNGEWIQIQIPFSLKLTSIYLEGINDSAYPDIKNYVIAGSNNGTTWSSISTGTLTNGTSRTIDTSSNTKYYTYYRLIIKSIYRSVVAVDYPDTKFTYSIKLKQLFFTGITDDLFSNVSFYNGKTLMIEGDAGISGNLNLNSTLNNFSYNTNITNNNLLILDNTTTAANLSTNGVRNIMFGTINYTNAVGNETSNTIIGTNLCKMGGSINVIMGVQVMNNATGASSFNTCMGTDIMNNYSLTNSGVNTAIGRTALRDKLSGTYNTAIGGGEAGSNDKYGSNNTFVGSATQVLDTNATYSNSTALGFGATITSSNQIVLGRTSEYVSIPSTKVSTSSTTGALVVSGGVGINGNVIVGGMIKTNNSTDYKKIVLYDQDSNEAVGTATNFYGLGIMGGVLRYQVPASIDYHRFYSSTTLNMEVGNGLVNISGALNVGGLIRSTNTGNINKLWVVYDNEPTANPLSTVTFAGFGINPDTLRYQVAYPEFFHSFYCGSVLNLDVGNGGVRIPTKLNVTGATTVGTNLTVAGGSNFGGTLTVSGATLLTNLTATGTTTSASFTSGTYYTNYNSDGGGVKTVTVPLNGLYSYIFGANYNDLNITNTAFVIAGGGSACRIYNHYNAGFSFTLTPTGGNTFTIVATYPAGYNSFSISYTKIG